MRGPATVESVISSSLAGCLAIVDPFPACYGSFRERLGSLLREYVIQGLSMFAK